MKQGVGTYIYSEGSKYEGLWRKGRRHGKGTFTKMVYKEDNVIKILANTKQKITFEDVDKSIDKESLV